MPKIPRYCATSSRTSHYMHTVHSSTYFVTVAAVRPASKREKVCDLVHSQTPSGTIMTRFRHQGERSFRLYYTTPPQNKTLFNTTALRSK